MSFFIVVIVILVFIVVPVWLWGSYDSLYVNFVGESPCTAAVQSCSSGEPGGGMCSKKPAEQLPKRSFQNLFLVNMASSTTVWIVGTLFSVLSILPVSFAQSPTIGFISPDVVTDIGKLLSKMTEKRLRKAKLRGTYFCVTENMFGFD